MTQALQPPDPWLDACRAVALVSVDPAGLGGLLVRSPAGEVRAALLVRLRRGFLSAGEAKPPLVQIAADVSAAQLLGGLDLDRTLALGRPVASRGALARANGGLLTLAMAERMSGATAALIAAALDSGETVTERDGFSERAPARFGIAALDEGIAADERPPAAIRERLAIHLDLTALSHRDMGEVAAVDIGAARARLAYGVIPDGVIESLCAAAAMLGVSSGRAPLLAVRAACASAALDGRNIVSSEDVTFAARMVLGPRATRLPPSAQPADEAPPPPEEREDDNPSPEQNAEGEVKALDDVVLAAAAAAIPPDLLRLFQENGQRAHRAQDSGKSGDSKKRGLRGRPIGSRRGDLRGNGRLDLLETLRSAAPWQKLRRRQAPARDAIQVRREDIRLKRFKDRQASTTIFVVDASGSTAMDRLGEAKGAVEMLLADCYVRRDEVALIAFRGTGADLLLPATRSLARARRSLAALPGGGGTPLASGLAAAERLADEVRRKGRTPTLVIITDGRANVARDGMGGRERAQSEANDAASSIRAHHLKAILVDNSPRPEPKARGIAERMGATYLPLPIVNASILSDAVRAHHAKPAAGAPR